MSETRVFLLSGFLGAGKTTLLQRILNWKSDMSDAVVIVNEFGEIGIDGTLLKDESSDIIELTTGCVCCTLKTDLKILLEKIWSRYSPRWMFIESSGVADPLSLITLFQESEIAGHIADFKAITVLDADCWKMREIMGRLFYLQLGTADLLILNKIDLMAKNEIPHIITGLQSILPGVEIMPSIQGAIDIDKLTTESRGHIGSLRHLTDRQSLSASEQGFFSFSFKDERFLDENCFHQFVREMPFEVFRMKGMVRFRDSAVVASKVGSKFDITPLANLPGETRLAFVGWGEDCSDAILDKLNTCLIN